MQKPLAKKLSKGVLDLKFMKKSKEKAQLQEENEERQHLYQNQLSSLLDGADRIVMLNSYFDCMEFLPCRLSFGGMDPDIEKINDDKLTGIYKVIKAPQPETGTQMDTDVAAEEMATVFYQSSKRKSDHLDDYDTGTKRDLEDDASERSYVKGCKYKREGDDQFQQIRVGGDSDRGNGSNHDRGSFSDRGRGQRRANFRGDGRGRNQGRGNFRGKDRGRSQGRGNFRGNDRGQSQGRGNFRGNDRGQSQGRGNFRGNDRDRNQGRGNFRGNNPGKGSNHRQDMGIFTGDNMDNIQDTHNDRTNTHKKMKWKKPSE